MGFFGSLLFVIGFIAILSGIIYGLVWWSNRRPTVPAANTVSESSLLALTSNQSLMFGAIFALAIGFTIATILHILVGYPQTLGARFILSLALAAPYYYWSTGFWVGFTVQPTYRGVVLWFGNKRVTAGPNGAGLEEGPNWLPLGYPFFVVSPEEAKEIKVPFVGCVVRTNNNVDFKVDGFIMVQKARPDVFRGVQQPYDSIMELTLQALRDEGKTMNDNAFATADKETLSDIVEIELRRLQAKYNNNDDRRWGLKVIDVEITAIKAPPDLQQAWNQAPIETARGVAEDIKVKRRVAQAKNFKEVEGTDGNMATAAALVAAGDAGAKISNVSLSGLDEVGKGIGAAGAGLGKGLGEGLVKLGEAIESFAHKP